VINAPVSGTHHGGPWHGGWAAEPLDPQPTVEGSYAGQLGPPKPRSGIGSTGTYDILWGLDYGSAPLEQ
jgi:hypothetical protein